MQKPAIPANEKERIQALLNFQVLDTLPEKAFDDITDYVARNFNVPIALISLVDVNRHWFKSCVGLSVNQVGRDEGFCAHAITVPTRLFIIPDTKADPRFADNPLVTNAPFARFYAGATLITQEGHKIGTLCVIDQKPRQLTKAQEEELIVLSDRVMQRLKLRLSNLALDQILNKVQAR